MEVRDAIMERKSIRGFKKREVPREIIEDILETSVRAVSANNTQPWEFAVVTGDVLKEISQKNVECFEKNLPFDYDGSKYEGIYRQRLIDIAVQLFSAMDIKREDKEKRLWWMQRGFRFFDAPVAIIMYMDKSLDEAACRLDMGCVVQNICLAAMDYELGTCVEDQAIMYQSGLREYLDIPEDKRFVVGIALGYPDLEFPANSVVSHRADIETIVKWYGFDK